MDLPAKTGESEAMFLNVDLEVASRQDLTPLVEELAPKLFVVHEQRLRGTHFVAFELAEQRYRTPDACLARLATLIERLSPAGRKLWTSATSRRFDVGIEAPQDPPAYADVVRPKALARAAALGVSLAVTVYPPEGRPSTLR